METTAKKAKYETVLEGTLERGYALGLDPQEYNRLLIRKKGSAVGVLFSPFRPNMECVFVPQGHTPRRVIKGTRREVDKKLIKRGYDVDTAERVEDEHTAALGAHMHFPDCRSC